MFRAIRTAILTLALTELKLILRFAERSLFLGPSGVIANTVGKRSQLSIRSRDELSLGISLRRQKSRQRAGLTNCAT
jgi:hypothetical protein